MEFLFVVKPACLSAFLCVIFDFFVHCACDAVKSLIVNGVDVWIGSI